VLSCLAIRAAARLSGGPGTSARLGARFVPVAATTLLEAGLAGARTAFKATVGRGFRTEVDVLERGRAAGRSRRTSRGSTSSRSPRKTGCRITPSRVHSANLTSATSTGLTQVGFSLPRGGVPLKGDCLTIRGFISLYISASHFSTYPP